MKLDLGDSDFSPDDIDTDITLEDLAVEYEPEAPVSPGIVEACEEVFAEDGTLAESARQEGRLYEYRPQQRAMARGVAEALRDGENLCVEAPTGVGKSFAYLVPLIYRAQTARRPAVVSTETITLQEQLIERDLPLLKKILGIEFKAVLAKGRRNYLCRRRFSLLSGAERDALLPTPSLVTELARLEKSLDSGEENGTRDGFDFSIDPTVWSMVCSEIGNCAGNKCPFFRNCFYYRARREWEDADIIVANHALLFTDLAMRQEGGGGLLPDYGALLIDEAHTLESNAAEHLGIHLSRFAVVGELQRLYNPDSARGLLMRSGSAFPELRNLAATARDEAYAFFTPYENWLSRKNESACRLPEDAEFPNSLTPALLKLASGLSEAAEEEEDAAFKTELGAHLERCRSFVDGIDAITRRTLPEAVYYAEFDHSAVTLHASPLNIAELLRPLLFAQDFPVILCSATLAVRKSFDYFISRTGFDGRTLLLDSPFSSDQAVLYIPRDMPDPSGEGFNAALAEEIFHYVEMSQGRAFVLFTNYQSLRYCAAALRTRFELRNWRLLVQGEDMHRGQLIRAFREDVSSVLFGTDSFWTGVDVPGEALSNVIITKLPFAQYGHPLIAAREERIRMAGKSPFAEYSLPEAVLKFRQGVGRLIRNRSDRGMVVVLDRRIIAKSYGRVFLESIPYHLSMEKI